MATATATKTKPTKPGTAVAKKAASNIVSIQEQLKAQAAAMNERTAPTSGIKIRLTKDKKFQLPDGSSTPGPLELVVVDFVTTHKFYEGKFDPKNPTPPVCFGIGTNPLAMAPSANSPKPQAGDCQECPMNQFGSDGNGKACKNGRTLAVLPPDATEKTPIWLLDVSPTALKGWDSHVKDVVRDFGVPPIGVVTTVELDQNSDYQKLEFTNAVPNENVAVHMERQAEARELLNQEPDVSRTNVKAAKPAARGRR